MIELKWKPGPPDLEGVPDEAMIIFSRENQFLLQLLTAKELRVRDGLFPQITRHIVSILPVEPEPKVPGCPVCHNPMRGTGGLFWHCNDCDLRWRTKPPAKR